MDPKQITAILLGLSRDVQPLVEKSKAGTLTDDESTQFDDLVGQMQKAQTDLIAANKRVATREAAEDMAKKYGETPRQLVDEKAGEKQMDYRSLGQQFVESDAYKNVDHKGRSVEPFVTDQSILPGSMSQKALITTGLIPAGLMPSQVMPQIYRGDEPMSAIRRVLGSMRTNAPSISIMRELVFTNSAAEVAEAAAVDAQAVGIKPESAITFEQVSIPLEVVAHWIPITRTTLEDAPMMSSYVDTRLRQGLERRLALQLISGDGTAPNISGILDQTALTVANAAYFAGSPVRDAGSDNENPNRLRRAKRLVQTVAHANATFILINPADAEDMETLSTTDGNYLFYGPTQSGEIGRMWGLPVYEDEYVTAKTAIVGDGSMAAVVEKGGASVYTTDSHEDFFIRNILVLLAETRACLAVFRPAAFVEVALA